MIVRMTLALVSLCFAGVFGLAYYFQYFQWRDCFNELGRCFDSETGTVYLEQSGIIWLSLTILSLVAASWQAYRALS